MVRIPLTQEVKYEGHDATRHLPYFLPSCKEMHEAEAVRLGIRHSVPPKQGIGLSLSPPTLIRFEAGHCYGATLAME